MVTITEEPLYTQSQLQEMIQISRSWTLNNPNGPITWIPLPKYFLQTTNGDKKIIEYNGKMYMPKYKKSHWLLRLLFKYAR